VAGLFVLARGTPCLAATASASLRRGDGGAPVPEDWTERLTSVVRLVLIGTVGAAVALPSIADVTSSTAQHDFTVEGTTARGLVRSLNGNAFEGDHGRAYASVHPDYQMSITTRETGGMCRPARIDVHVDFDLTLPVADTSRMNGRVRGAWNNFLMFAWAHENHHRQSYLGCAQSFVVQARRQAAPSCVELESDLDQMLYAMKRACEVKQRPFDQSQARALRDLGLFELARAGR
jgi:predicted secreted Zn-dependent protease